MLPPAISPIHRLVIGWWNQPPPRLEEAGGKRVELLQAAIQETQLKQQHNTPYNAIRDHRIIWAAEWLDVACGFRPRINENVEAAAALLIEPPITSHQHAAANDHD